MKQFLLSIFLLSLISGCGGGSESNSENPDTEGASENITGSITLTGADTATVGTQLSPRYINSFTGAPDYIVIDTASAVNPTPADALNGFTLVVTDDSSGSGGKFISMAILVDGTKHDYACTTPVTTFIDCGGLNNILLDIENTTVTLTNVTVTNTDTSTILTMNGTLSW